MLFAINICGQFFSSWLPKKMDPRIFCFFFSFFWKGIAYFEGKNGKLEKSHHM
jgi:hypothetical protein